jgi:hypothetical protein
MPNNGSFNILVILQAEKLKWLQHSNYNYVDCIVITRSISPKKSLNSHLLIIGYKNGSFKEYVHSLENIQTTRFRDVLLRSITNILAGRWVRDWTHRGWLQVCLVFITCHFGKILKSTEEFYNKHTCREVRPIPDSPNLQVCLVFITCHFGKKY